MMSILGEGEDERDRVTTHADRLRAIATQLNDLATALEDASKPRDAAKGMLGADSSQDEIELISQQARPYDDMRLAILARSLHRLRARRSRYFKESFFAEPAWDMLLDLFLQTTLGRRITTSSLCIASGVPATTALRWIQTLEDQDLIMRNRSGTDQRMNIVGMTSKGYLAMRECLSEWERSTRENPTLLELMLKSSKR